MKLFLAFVVGVLVCLALSARSMTPFYPSVEQLQSALNARPGTQFPRELYANDKIWTAWYVGAKSIGGGRYVVIVQLYGQPVPSH